MRYQTCIKAEIKDFYRRPILSPFVIFWWDNSYFDYKNLDFVLLCIQSQQLSKLKEMTNTLEQELTSKGEELLVTKRNVSFKHFFRLGFI